eukprot:3597394-Pleurochrysis_carterae.AAC.1
MASVPGIYARDCTDAPLASALGRRHRTRFPTRVSAACARTSATRRSSVGDTSTVHRYGRGATSVLPVSAVRASRLRIRDRMN